MNKKSIPQHIGFIVDGNRRWAGLNGIKSDVHRKGADVVFDVARRCVRKGVKFTTFYIFSTENWHRSPKEVTYLMKLFIDYFKERIDELVQEDIRTVFLGTREHLSVEVLKTIAETEEATKNGAKGTCAFCFNYGGQQELADACRKIVESKVSPEEVTVGTLNENIYHPEIPQIDLVVRTGGEERVSNFMLWRLAYAEFLFLEKLWPELTDSDVDSILDEFNGRQRRFGH